MSGTIARIVRLGLTAALFCLVAAPGAWAASDLIPQNIAVSPTTVAPGGSITASWSIVNQGANAANATSTTVVRITQSSTLAAGTNLASISTSALAAGASASQSRSLTVPTTPGTYYVWVIADNSDAVTNQSSTANDIQRSAAFTVQVAVTAPSLSSPTGGQTVSNTSPQLRWSGGSGFASLQVNVSRSPFGSSNIVYTSSWLSASTTSVTPTGLVAGTNYRWDVTACSGANGSGTCVTSSNATFSTPAAQALVTAPSLSSPTDGQTVSNTSPQLQWSGGSGFASLQVNVSRSPFGSSNIVYTSSWLSASTTSVTPTGLVAGTNYRWDVTACSGANGSGTCVTSSNATFSTPAAQAVVTAPGLSSPTGGQTVSNTSPQLQWSGGSGFASLQVNVSRSPFGSSNIVYTSSWLSASTTSVTPTGLVAGTNYRWDVTACSGANGSGTCVTSSNATFSTPSAPAVVTAPSPSFPTGGQTVSGTPPSLQWSGGGGFASLQINVSRSPFGSANLVYTSAWLSASTTSVTPTGLVASTSYRWDVTACSGANGSGTCATSANATFSTPAASSTTSDLLAENIAVSPSPVAPGAPLTVTWRLANRGSATASSASTTMVRINQSATSAQASNLRSVSTAALGAGGTADQSASLTAPTGLGTYYVWVIADNYSSVTNQGANAGNDIQRSAAFTVQGGDLVAPTPASPINGQTLSSSLNGPAFDATLILNWFGGANFTWLRAIITDASREVSKFTSQWLSSGTTSITVPQGALSDGANYLWTITACTGPNGTGTCRTSGDAAFSTSTTPGAIAGSFSHPYGESNTRNWYVTGHFDDPLVLSNGSTGYHLGVDWNQASGDLDIGETVYAIADGTVQVAREVAATEARGWGKIVIIQHTLPGNSQLESLYAHFDTIDIAGLNRSVDGDVVEGKTRNTGRVITVRRGQPIGTIGKPTPGEPCMSSGINCAHLHLEMRDNTARNWGTYSSPAYPVAPGSVGWFDPEKEIDRRRSGAAPSSIFAAILPSARSVSTDSAATAFAQIVNDAPTMAKDCRIDPPPGFPADFTFQTTNSANQIVGAPNAPVDIPAGGIQGFVFGLTPNRTLDSAQAALVFACRDRPVVASVTGLNTLLVSASPGAAPDMVSIGATVTNDGIVHVPGASGVGAFAAATLNIGAAGSITATVDDGGRGLQLTTSLCQTNPTNGVCVNPATPTDSATFTSQPNDITTVSVFVTGAGVIPFDPANNRLFLRFKTADGVTRGATSVAVKTD